MGLFHKLKTCIYHDTNRTNKLDEAIQKVVTERISLDQDEAACYAAIDGMSRDNIGITVEATLPFFGDKVRVELDSASLDDIAFAKRQLALLNALPVETYEQLCRHTVDYAADIVNYVGEYLGMFDEEEFADELLPPIAADGYSALEQDLERWFTVSEINRIVGKLEEYAVDVNGLDREHLLQLIAQAVLELELYKNNFHHVWPVVEQDLIEHPLHIMRFIRLTNVGFSHLKDYGREVLAACLQFECDWEPEHGLSWSIIKSNGVSVCEAMQAPELTSACYENYCDKYNYCFHKTILSRLSD